MKRIVLCLLGFALTWGAVAEQGLLLVRSEPTGAEVIIDRHNVGKSPILITTLDANKEHTITFRKPGYLPEKRDFKFNHREPLVIDGILVVDSASLTVESVPAGAEVAVNGNNYGVTPVRVSSIPKGDATITLSLKGYNLETRKLKLKAGDDIKLSCALRQIEIETPVAVKKREVGRLEVRSSPAGAAIVLNGQRLGETIKSQTDNEFSEIFAIEDICEGEQTLVLRMEGYADATRHPKIRAGKTSQANVRLKKIFKPNTMIVTDYGAFDGRLVEEKDGMVTLEVKPGIQQSFPLKDIRERSTVK